MDDALLSALAIGLGIICLLVGYGMGQATCRRQARNALWVLFHAIDQEPTAGKVRYDLLNLIRRLEL